jgi:pre-rRNA-processing protein TSR3
MSLPNPSPPPTVIVVHPKEKRSKCTVEGLRGDPRFVFHRFPHRPANLGGYVRLGLGGPALSATDVDCGLLILDGTWRWAGQMEAAFADVPVRSLPRLETAYPRTSKVFSDPAEGLATIEAVYAALRLLGRDVTNLWGAYPWASSFVARNSAAFAGKDFRQYSAPETPPSS